MEPTHAAKSTRCFCRSAGAAGLLLLTLLGLGTTAVAGELDDTPAEIEQKSARRMKEGNELFAKGRLVDAEFEYKRIPRSSRLYASAQEALAAVNLAPARWQWDCDAQMGPYLGMSEALKCYEASRDTGNPYSKDIGTKITRLKSALQTAESVLLKKLEAKIAVGDANSVLDQAQHLCYRNSFLPENTARLQKVCKAIHFSNSTALGVPCSSAPKPSSAGRSTTSPSRASLAVQVESDPAPTSQPPNNKNKFETCASILKKAIDYQNYFDRDERIDQTYRPEFFLKLKEGKQQRDGQCLVEVWIASRPDWKRTRATTLRQMGLTPAEANMEKQEQIPDEVYASFWVNHENGEISSEDGNADMILELEARHSEMKGWDQ